MVVIEYGASFTQRGVVTSVCTFEYDPLRTAEDHHRDFVDLGSARFNQMNENAIVLECGTQSGFVALEIGKGRGDFIPKLHPGKYGAEHTLLGNLLVKTKRVIDYKNGTMSLLFGIVRKEWPDMIYSCTLVQPDSDGRGAIKLLADDNTQPIEPTPGFRFYTPFHHIPNAGISYSTSKLKDRVSTYSLYKLGIMTLHREQLSELLRAFNDEWLNGPIFARKNSVDGVPSPPPPVERTRGRGSSSMKKKEGGLSKWC